MSRQLQLFLGREDSQTGESFLLGRLLDENRFREVHLAGDGLHLIIGQIVPIREYRKGIALEARSREDV
jgi:hypothetical protein